MNSLYNKRVCFCSSGHQCRGFKSNEVFEWPLSRALFDVTILQPVWTWYSVCQVLPKGTKCPLPVCQCCRPSPFVPGHPGLFQNVSILRARFALESKLRCDYGTFLVNLKFSIPCLFFLTYYFQVYLINLLIVYIFQTVLRNIQPYFF